MYRTSRSRGLRPRRAAVLGGGVAGVAAAAALRGACDEVVIYERDVLAPVPASRRGTPQAGQLHNLMTRAQRHLEEVLPGFREALMAAGGNEAEVATQTHVWESGVRMPESPLGLRIWSAPQPMIESVMRSLLPRDGIHLRDGLGATGLALEDRGEWVVQLGGGDCLVADIVVDAMGVGSPMLRWLAALGFEQPPVQEVVVGQWYVSMLVERSPQHRGLADCWMVFPSPPGSAGGLLSPSGPNRWVVSVSGRADDEPPRSEGDVHRYAEHLEDPMIAEVLRGSTAISAPVLYRRPVASWRRWDLVRHPAPGLMAIGDAVGALNPLLGQGVSVAAWQAAELRTTLDETTGVDVAAHRYAERAARACAAAWDLQLLSDPGESSVVLTSEDWRAITQRVFEDAEIHRRYVGVWHLLEPVTYLLELAGFVDGTWGQQTCHLSSPMPSN